MILIRSTQEKCINNTINICINDTVLHNKINETATAKTFAVATCEYENNTFFINIAEISCMQPYLSVRV